MNELKLNNLIDISMLPQYAEICGFSEERGVKEWKIA